MRVAGVFRRELRLRYKSSASWVQSIVFFIMVLVLFPLALGANLTLLHQVAPAVVWVAALLSILLGVDTLFRSDLDDGTLEQIVVSRFPLTQWAVIKVLVHWMSGGLLLVALSGLVVPLYGLSMTESGTLALSLLVGTPTLTLLAALAAALTVPLRGQIMLIPLLALPLQLPILIFATGMVSVMQRGESILPILALLLAGMILAGLILPWAMAAALRLSLQS